MPSTPPTEIVCSLFNGIRPAVRDVWEGSWEAFVSETIPALLAERARDKKRLTGIVLAPVDGRRDDAHCGAHTALAIDVDRLPDNDLGALLKRAKRYRCAVYETPSSEDDAPRVRVIVALDAPLEPEHVIAARRAFAEALKLDPEECGTAGAIPPSQVMFVGRIKGTRERGLWTSDGKLYAPPRVETDERKTRTRPRAQPLDTRRHASASGRERHAPRGGAFSFDSPPDLTAIAKHVPPPGHDGDRHLLVRGLGGWLARRGYDPEAIAEAVRLQIPSTDPAERAAQAQDAAERVRRGEDAPGWEALERWAQGYAKGASTLRRLERACRDPREPAGFDGGQTGEVWSEWWAKVLPIWDARLSERRAKAEAAREVTDGAERVVAGGDTDGTGLHLHPLTGWPWILQKGNFYWLHTVSSAEYNPEVPQAELEASVARDLAGLVSEEDRAPTALRSSWIKPLRSLRSTYTARAHTYDPEVRTLTLAALRWTDRPAKRHAHIDRWLRALFGQGYDAAAQWLASLLALDRPAPCLYLPGPPGVGKTLLANGLASLWRVVEPVDMAEAIDNFNEASAECPLVFTDEGFPEGLNFSTFRKMVTQHSRRVNPKHRAKVSVEGCGRYMIAANNSDVFRYQKIGTLTKDDLEAIADRLRVILCCEEAREVLDQHSHDELTQWARADIAEHVLWLAETVPLEPAGRMAAKPGGGESILASVVAGRSSEVLTRIREAIGTGAMGEKSGVKVPKGERRVDTEVWVNVGRLAATFDGRVPLAAVKEACESFALRPGAEQHKSADGENLRWRVLSRLRLADAFAKLD
jgi:hypothetical protein